MQTEQVNLSIPDACRLYGVGRTVLYEKIGNGEIRAIKLGARRLIPRAELDAYFRRLWEEQHGRAA